MNLKTVIYPGTFDPITNGHLDIIKRATKIFDNLIIGIAKNSEKNPLFTEEVRKQMIETTLKDASIKNATVEIFGGLLVDFAKNKNSFIIIRGLRAVSDFEYEFQMACVNSRLEPTIETIFLPSSDDMHFISSRFVKNIALLKGDVSGFVPTSVIKELKLLKF